MSGWRAPSGYGSGCGRAGRNTGCGAHGAAKIPLGYAGCAAGIAVGMAGRARRKHTTSPSDVQDTTASSSIGSGIGSDGGDADGNEDEAEGAAE
jgi:hypothetical protein